MESDKIKDGYNDWLSSLHVSEFDGLDAGHLEKAWQAGAEWMLSQASSDFKDALAKINVYDGYEKAQLEMWQSARLSSAKEIIFASKQVDLISDAAMRVGKRNTRLRQEIAEKDERIKELEEKIAELETKKTRARPKRRKKTDEDLSYVALFDTRD